MMFFTKIGCQIVKKKINNKKYNFNHMNHWYMYKILLVKKLKLKETMERQGIYVLYLGYLTMPLS